MASRDEPAGNRQQQRAHAADAEVDRPLDDGVEPLQRYVVDVDDGNAVEIFEARAQRQKLHQIRHDLDVDHLAARAFDQVEHLHVLVERQRHIEVVDVLLSDDLGRVRQRAEQRQTAIAQVIAAGTIVDEANHLVAELSVLKDFLGHDPAQIAGARNQNALQPEPGFPAAFEQFAHELARAERQRDVDDQEHRPDDARHLVGADRLFFRRCVVRVHVERGDDAENDRHDSADEDQKEVVDP